MCAAALIAATSRVASAQPVDITVIPPGCEQYAAGVIPDPDQAWNQLMSFAGCVQDATIARITDRAQLRPVVDQLHDALTPAIALYLEAIEYGPPEIRLRAAYATGSANIALITRLRRSLVAPADWSDGAAVARYRALQAELEPLLVRAQRTAWVAFSVVDRAAARDPSIARDPVARYAVTAARAMLAQMKRVRELTGPAPVVGARTAI
ncbi:MAG TPA: hypothetical protein VF516_25020 [Kofleriaceae bacterium]